jgi:hypothetical protein
VCAAECAPCNCHCASGVCDERFTCCNEFRYGQCHQDLACVGPIVCRVVTCVAPWDFDATCTTTSATANATALHDAPCPHEFSSSVLAFGAATDHGEPEGPLLQPVVGIEATPTGGGYWLVASDGGVFCFGDARFFGSMGGKGYWFLAADGGISAFGDARYMGGGTNLAHAGDATDIAGRTDGRGYWIATDT